MARRKKKHGGYVAVSKRFRNESRIWEIEHGPIRENIEMAKRDLSSSLGIVAWVSSEGIVYLQHKRPSV